MATPLMLRPICPECSTPVAVAGQVCSNCTNAEDDGCPKNDPDCLGGDGDCHDACESSDSGEK